MPPLPEFPRLDVLGAILGLISRAFDFHPNDAIQSELKAQLEDFKAQLTVDPAILGLINDIQGKAIACHPPTHIPPDHDSNPVDPSDS